MATSRDNGSLSGTGDTGQWPQGRGGTEFRDIGDCEEHWPGAGVGSGIEDQGLERETKGHREIVVEGWENRGSKA